MMTSVERSRARKMRDDNEGEKEKESKKPSIAKKGNEKKKGKVRLQSVRRRLLVDCILAYSAFLGTYRYIHLYFLSLCSLSLSLSPCLHLPSK